MAHEATGCWTPNSTQPAPTASLWRSLINELGTMIAACLHDTFPTPGWRRAAERARSAQRPSILSCRGVRGGGLPSAGSGPTSSRTPTGRDVRASCRYLARSRPYRLRRASNHACTARASNSSEIDHHMVSSVAGATGLATRLSQPLEVHTIASKDSSPREFGGPTIILASRNLTTVNN